jgi:hypothetical protein
MLQCLNCPYNTKIKCNYERHIFAKHKKVSLNLNNMSLNLNNMSSNLNNMSSNLNNMSSNLNNPNQCEQCDKTYSSKKSLKAHLLICKGPIINEKLCEHCNKILASKQSKIRHQLICKETVSALTIINNIDNSITNNSITNNNIINIYNTIIFSDNPRKATQFIKEEMTYRKISDIINSSGGNDKRIFEKMYRLILDNPSNRCIIKRNMKLKFSKAYIGNKRWISKLDNELYPKLLTDICVLISELLEEHEERLSAKYKPMRIENINQFLQDIQMFERGDTPDGEEEKEQYDDFIECLEVLKMITNDYSNLILET